MKKYINDIYNKTLDVIKDVLNDYRFIYTLFSGLIFGVIAHGMMIFNKYSFFDDVGYFNNVGLMFPLGRWGLWFVQLCAYHLLGTKHVSNSTFNGVLSIIFIIFTVYTLVRLLNIKKKHLIVLLTGLFVSYPTVASAFGYMFTAPYYFFGTFIGVLGLSIYSKNKNIIKFIICISLLALGTGLYQANIPVYIATMLLIMYVNVSNKDINIKDFILEGFNYVLVCISFMIEYILINNILLKVFNQSLESARGVNSFGLTSVSGYISRILTAYKEFISPTTSSNGSGAVFAYSNFYYHILLVIVGLLLVVNLLKKVDNTKRIELIIILILLPLASYFVYVMCGIEYVHSLMMYGFLMMFVLLILLLENIQAGGVLRSVALILIGLMITCNIRIDNTCYTKVDLLHTQAIAYLTELKTRIESTDGYYKDMPVVFIGYGDDKANVPSVDHFFDDIYLIPYESNTFINGWSWYKYTRMYNSYNFNYVDGDYSNNDEVNNMPIYPSEGSIKILDDGNLVVKFIEQ